MKCEHLYEEFKKFEGSPVKIFTDSGRCYCGIDLVAREDCVLIMDKCSRMILIPYMHIDAVVEPQMELDNCCNDNCDCECKGDKCKRECN
jgi:hypothetical protein